MIDKEYGKFIMVCESLNCGEELKADSFDELIALAKEEEWKFSNKRDDWEHWCYECAKWGNMK